MNLYLLKNFNNYYNRVVKKYDTIEQYPTAYLIKGNINFVPRNGVDTIQLINDAAAAECDYLIAVNNDGDIVSRWFIIDGDFKRAGQVELTLKRDTIADNWESVLNSTAYINKGYVKPNNPLIFNSEGLQFNQIKTSEHLLKNENDFPWLVIYYTKNFDLSGMYKSGKGWQNPYVKGEIDNTGNSYLMQVINGSSVIADDFVETLEELPYISDETVYTNNTIFSINIPTDYLNSSNTWVKGRIEARFTMDGLNYNDYEFTPDKTPGLASSYQLQLSEESDDLGKLNEVINQNYFNNIIQNVPTGFKDIKDAAEILSLNQKTYFCDATQKYYKYTVKTMKNEITGFVGNGTNLNRVIDTPIYNKGITSTLLHAEGYTTVFDEQLSNNELIKAVENVLKVEVEVVNRNTEDSLYIPIDKIKDVTTGELTSNGFYLNIHTNEAYDVIAIPYTDMPFNDIDNSINKNQRLAIATNLIGSDSVIKDIQLVPYVPVDYTIVDGKIILNDGDYGKLPIRSGPYKNSYTEDYALMLKKVQFSKSFTHNIEIIDKKTTNECDMYRLVSPNYNGVFEFNPAHFTFKNDTNPITTWNVDVTLKPYQPYIHVYPNFSGLYGTNFGDARGLICEGDYSLSRLSDAFTTYALENKNYDAQFRREIKSMKKQYNWNVAEAAAGAVTGSALGGLIGGSRLGVAGGIAGGVVGAAEGGLNIAESISLGKDQINLAKDKYNYNIQNIQAVPDTLTKVTAFNQNNKVFPFIEYYTCTDVEKEAFKNKIKYEGMTVNIVGILKDYIGRIQDDTQYIRADVIRINNISDDYHITNDIANELKRGVYYEL